MGKPKLKIHEMSIENFNNSFKKKNLDNIILTKENLSEIEKQFGLDDRSENSKTGKISCDEYHSHSYKCIHYNSPEAGIVDRLINEIKRYKERIDNIRDSLEED